MGAATHRKRINVANALNRALSLTVIYRAWYRYAVRKRSLLLSHLINE